jgi:hypothetical protein
MATPAGIQALKSAAHQYLTDENFGMVEIGTVMLKVFHDNPDRVEALAWAAFWTQPNIHEEKVWGGEEAGEAPKVSSLFFPFIFNEPMLFLGFISVITTKQHQDGTPTPMPPL